MARRKPYVRTAKPADRYARPSERIVEFGGPFGGGLMLVKSDAPDELGRTVVELYRLDPNVLVRVPTVNLPERHVEAENLVAYATEAPDTTVVLTDGGATARLTIRQARALARELRQAARTAELVALPGPSREYAEGDPDPTPDEPGDWCGRTAPDGTMRVCTWSKGQPHRQHVAGNGEAVLVVWENTTAVQP